MNVQELAEELRERQRQRAPEFVAEMDASGHPTTLENFIIQVNRINDRVIIEGYITCSHCGEMECSYEKATELAKFSFSVDEWLDYLDALRRHR